MNEERFLSILKEAKDLFVEKLKVAEQLKGENKKLLDEIKHLKAKNEDTSSENKRLSEKLSNSKKFVKIYFTEQLCRMKEIEKNGVYNAETFSYLVGDVARSLCNTTLLSEIENNEINKKPLQGKLSTNKENKRTRYEDVKPSKNQTNYSTTSNISNTLTTKNVEEKRDVLFCQKQQSNNEETLDLLQTTFSTHQDLRGQTTLVQHQHGKVKSYNFHDVHAVLDASLSLPVSIGFPSKTSTQNNSVENKRDDTTHSILPSHENEKLQRKSSNIYGSTENNNLDPDLTLCLPLSPPSKCSTPQDLRFDEEPKKFAVAFSPPQTSPPILIGEDSEGLRCTHLSQIPLMEGEVPEETQPQSPTILTRSHSVTRTTILAAASLEHRTPKRKRNDPSFRSILPSENLESKDGSNEGTALGETITRLPSKNESRKQLSNPSSSKNKTLSPDMIFLDDSGFLKPNSTGVPRKKPKIASVIKESSLDKSSLLFASPQAWDSPAPSSKKSRGESDESKDSDENKAADEEKPKITLNFNLDESTDDQTNQKRKEEKCPQYKYKEVVRGKDKRAKLNGYFCADCEKYYGGLKLSEAEMKERLKACSRHRARFSPPPSTPEHFWEVDFMNTDQYIEKGFMRTESELPPEKRKLKSRRLKMGERKK